jgi:hypothetical protein
MKEERLVLQNPEVPERPVKPAPPSNPVAAMQARKFDPTRNQFYESRFRPETFRKTFLPQVLDNISFQEQQI